jgi:hypothetical protein
MHSTTIMRTHTTTARPIKPKTSIDGGNSQEYGDADQDDRERAESRSATQPLVTFPSSRTGISFLCHLRCRRPMSNCGTVFANIGNNGRSLSPDSATKKELARGKLLGTKS